MFLSALSEHSRLMYFLQFESQVAVILCGGGISVFPALVLLICSAIFNQRFYAGYAL